MKIELLYNIDISLIVCDTFCDHIATLFDFTSINVTDFNSRFFIYRK